MEKIVCPYCLEELANFANEPDKVARCGICGEITCGLCIETHYKEKHLGFIQFGKLDENGVFQEVKEWNWEDKGGI